MTNDNITKFPSSGPPPGNSGGGNGNDFDSRLRSVEIDLATIKERTANMATKNDVTMLKVWILGGVAWRYSGCRHGGYDCSEISIRINVQIANLGTTDSMALWHYRI